VFDDVSSGRFFVLLLFPFSLAGEREANPDAKRNLPAERKDVKEQRRRALDLSHGTFDF
jgi:hypothetical protein